VIECFRHIKGLFALGIQLPIEIEWMKSAVLCFDVDVKQMSNLTDRPKVNTTQ
jgi:hypothetical protein